MLKSTIQSNLILQGSFALFALGAFGAVDYISQRAQNGPGYSVVDWAGDVVSRVHVTLRRPDPGPTLADMIPPAPEGWQVRTFEREDITLATGAPAPEKKNYSLGQIAFGATPMSGIDSEAEYRTYTSGDNVILFKYTRVPNAALTGLTGAAVDQMLTFVGLADARGGFVAAKDGLFFYETVSDKYPGARVIHAKLGKQLDITLITRMPGNEGILGILAGLDVAGLNALAVEPVEGLGTGGLVTAAPAGGDPQVAGGGEMAEALGIDTGAAPDVAGGAADAPAVAVPAGNAAAGAMAYVGKFLGRGSGDGAGNAGSAGSVPAPKKAAAPPSISCKVEKGFKRCVVGE